MSASEYMQSLPVWIPITGGAFLLILLIGGGPFAGWILERRRTRPARVAAREGAKRWIETGEVDMQGLKDALEKDGLDAKYFPAIETSPVIVIRDDSVTQELDEDAIAWTPEEGDEFDCDEKECQLLGFCRGLKQLADERAEQETPEEASAAKPAWAEQATGAYDVLTEEFLDGELLGPDPEREARELFEADPLFSWVSPPEGEQVDFLPEADRVFRDLVSRNWLTGEGADVDTDWTPLFTNYELEEVYA